MPVLRQREEVRSTVGQGAGVTSGANDPSGRLLAQQADGLARRANEVGRAMAAAADDEGKALAKAAVFSTGPNGAPVMPPAITERMGTIARKSLNLSLEEKFAHQLTTAIRSQINDAEASNQFDRDAFTQDAQARLAKMAGDIPPEMGGMFQQISTGLLVDANASIGMRQGRLEIEDAKSRVPVQVDDAINGIKERVLQGADVAAQAHVDNALRMIDGQPLSVMNAGEKRAEKDRILIETGSARMLRDLGLTGEDVTPDQLFDLATRLRSGEDPELMKFFTHEGSSTPSFELARRAAETVVMPLVGNANVNTARRKDAATLAGDRSRVASGSETPTEKNRAILDDCQTGSLGLKDANGVQVRMSPELWGQLSDEDRHIAVRVAKDAGFMSHSMAGFFRQAQNSLDPQMLADAFILYRDLQGVPNSKGKVTDLSGEIPEGLQAIFAGIDAHHGDGGASQESVGRAVTRFLTLRDGAKEFDDEALARRLNADNRFRDGRGRVTAETAQEAIRDAVTRTVFEGIEATSAEKAQAVTIFLGNYQEGLTSFEQSLEFTRQSMEGRFTETKFMNVQRSSLAPEKHYPDPPPGGIVEAFTRLDRKVAGTIVQSLPGFQTVWNLIMPTRATEIDADRLRASTFELLADVEIRSMIEAMGDDAPEGLLAGDGLFIFDKMLVGGQDYVLTPSTRTGKTPIYNVGIRDANGRMVQIGELDLREQFATLTKTDNNMREAQEFLKERDNQIITEDLMGPSDDPEKLNFLLELMEENPDMPLDEIVIRNRKRIEDFENANPGDRG